MGLEVRLAKQSPPEIPSTEERQDASDAQREAALARAQEATERLLQAQREAALARAQEAIERMQRAQNDMERLGPRIARYRGEINEVQADLDAMPNPEEEEISRSRRSRFANKAVEGLRTLDRLTRRLSEMPANPEVQELLIVAAALTEGLQRRLLGILVQEFENTQISERSARDLKRMLGDLPLTEVQIATLSNYLDQRVAESAAAGEPREDLNPAIEIMTEEITAPADGIVIFVTPDEAAEQEAIKAIRNAWLAMNAYANWLAMGLGQVMRICEVQGASGVSSIEDSLSFVADAQMRARDAVRGAQEAAQNVAPQTLRGLGLLIPEMRDIIPVPDAAELCGSPDPSEIVDVFEATAEYEDSSPPRDRDELEAAIMTAAGDVYTRLIAELRAGEFDFPASFEADFELFANDERRVTDMRITYAAPTQEERVTYGNIAQWMAQEIMKKVSLPCLVHYYHIRLNFALIDDNRVAVTVVEEK